MLISPGGGEEPRWARDGRQIFNRQSHRMMQNLNARDL
jgi:hypothetical protein